jgi:hypothetical protein
MIKGMIKGDDSMVSFGRGIAKYRFPLYTQYFQHFQRYKIKVTEKATARSISLFFIIFIIQFITLNNATSVCEASGDIVRIGGEKIFEINWSNWRIWIAIALAISVLIVTILYFVSSFLRDEGLKARARGEVFQLLATACISIFFVAFFQFLCSPIIPSIFGFSENVFDKSESYLSNMASWTRFTFYEIFFSLSLQNWYDSFSEKSAGKNPLTWGFAGGLSNIVPKALLTMFLFCYMSANMHVQLLHFLQPYTLMFLIPVGITLRSFFPFRRFGGALLGAGIALIVILPLLILLNALIVGVYFEKSELLDINCNSNNECLSKVCNQTTHRCDTSLAIGEECDQIIGNWQCASGRCINGKCADAASLKDVGEQCMHDNDCKSPLWCDDSNPSNPHCSNPLPIGEICFKDTMCGAPGDMFCNSTHYCQQAKLVGEECEKDEECGTLRCVGTAPYKKCEAAKFDQRQITIEIGKTATGGNVVNKFSIWKILYIPIQYITLALVAAVFLPLLNFLLLSRAVKDFSSFFGAEIDIASIYRVL